MKLVTAQQMQAIDRNAIDGLGIPGAVLMENAGRAAADLIRAEMAQLFPGPVLVLAGRGNNGGDGYVVARLLADQGWQVQTLILGAPERIAGDALGMLQILQNLSGPVTFAVDSEVLDREFQAISPVLIVDALLGTGLSKTVTGLFAQAIDLINGCSAPVVALDIPSGVNGSDGRIMGGAVAADLTLSFDTAKIGHASRPGADFVGVLRVLDIGIPRARRPHLEWHCSQLDAAEAATLLPLRSQVGHKGTFGHLGVIAGSVGMTGAAALCSEAGLRSGAGLVTLACPATLHDILEVKLTEVMTLPLSGGGDCLTLKNIAEVRFMASTRQALVIGPGLGRHAQTELAVRRLIADCPVPLVLDADALNALSGQPELLNSPVSAGLILTPHPGEFSRLTGLSIAEIEADRLRIVCQFARDHQLVLLLKGAKTVIADAAGNVRINGSGNSGLATAGSGDVLSGLIGGLLVQGLSPFDAASLAAWLHGAAADLLAEQGRCTGLLATDLLKTIPAVRSQLEGVCLC